MSERTAPALAQLDALLPLIAAMPSSPTRTQLVDEAEALKRAVSAFHLVIRRHDLPREQHPQRVFDRLERGDFLHGRDRPRPIEPVEPDRPNP